MPELKSKYVSKQEMFTENQTCLILVLVHGIFKSVSRLLSETAVTPLSLPLVLQSRVIRYTFTIAVLSKSRPEFSVYQFCMEEKYFLIC